MPDLVTHSFAAWLLVRPERWRKTRLLFFFGTFLPDMVSRPIYILFPQLNGYSLAMHTPIFIFFCGLLAAEFMAPNLRHGARLAVSAGIILHFALDVMQRHLGSGYYWFFPFSWKSYELAWFWPEETIRWVPVWLGLMLSGEICLYLHQKRSAQRRQDS